MLNDVKNIKSICGIDTLYYFAESNEEYDSFFFELKELLEEKISPFVKNEIRFNNSDMVIDIEGFSLVYLGKPEGFYMFRDSLGLFRVGFKDRYTNRGLHDIRVQLEAYGIYTLGLKPLLEYVNANFLAPITTGHFPVSRSDLNCFINCDLSPYMHKEHFSTKKRRFLEYSKTIESTTTKESFYIGKSPFMLRVYDRLKELNSADKDKKEALLNHLIAYGELDISKPVFNIEFELHRAYLKRFAIDSIEHLLDSAKTVFNECLEEIRLINLDSISKNDMNNGHKYRASTHPLWQHIGESYAIKDFLSIDSPIECIKRKQTGYSLDSAFLEHLHLFKKANIYNIYISSDFYREVRSVGKKLLEHKRSQKTKEEPWLVVEFHSKDTEVEKYRLINGELIKPITSKSIAWLSDLELYNYKDKLKGELDNPFSNKEDIGARLKVVEIEEGRRKNANK